MPWVPSEPGEVPTLGWVLLDWIAENMARPELDHYEPFVPTREQAEFLLRFYEVDPFTGRRKVRRGVISRPRGWGKSPFTGLVAACEALGPVVLAGWDADGQPVGAPWSNYRRSLVEIAAVSEAQVDTNTWAPLVDMLANGPVVDNYPGLEPLAGFINLPYGRIQKRTAEARSAKGAPVNFVVCDQTEGWTSSNGGLALFNTLRNNVVKRGGALLESPNAYIPGEGSVAENSAKAYLAMRDGKTQNTDGLLYDHREAPAATDIGDAESLMAGLRYAYGDAADVEACAIHSPACEHPGWVDLTHIASSIWDVDADVQVSRSDFLNQITHATDSWLSQPEIRAVVDATKVVADREVITLGFDGSRERKRGVTDATALIGCRLSDGHLFQVEVWEQPPNQPVNTPWRVPTLEVDRAVRNAFDRYTVVGFYADPAKWESWIAQWEADFNDRLKVKASRANPIEWWMTGNRSVQTVQALAQFHTAVVEREMTLDGSSALIQHLLNARRRTSRSGTQIAKEHPDSDRKIDAAVAAVLAWQARLDAIAAGLGNAEAPRRTLVRRLR